MRRKMANVVLYNFLSMIFIGSVAPNDRIDASTFRISESFPLHYNRVYWTNSILGRAYHIWTGESSIYQGHFCSGIASKQSTRKWRRKPHFSEIHLALTVVNNEDSSCQMAPKTLFWCRVYNCQLTPNMPKMVVVEKTGNVIFLAWITIRPFSAVVDILTYDSFRYVATHMMYYFYSLYFIAAFYYFKYLPLI